MLHIDLLSRTPIYEQITREIENFILTGALKAGEQVPSVRRIALEEGINPRTVLKSFADLDARGIIVSLAGKGYFVAEDAIRKINEGKREKLAVFRALTEELASAGVQRSELFSILADTYGDKTND